MRRTFMMDSPYVFFQKAVFMPKVENNAHNFEMCMEGNCSACPSYPHREGEGLYCARGPSPSRVDKKGCNCPECPIWIQNGLSGMYFCAKPLKS
jgi:hypothetical protein